MRFLLTILCLFVLSCEDDPVSPIHGCLNSNACNYNSSASIENDSCEYPDEGYDCDGNCIYSDPVGCITGFGCCLFEATLYDDGITNNTIAQFSEELDLSQFTIESFDLSYECEDDPTGYCDLNINTDGIYKISNSEKFGVDCFLYYDNNYKILTGYNVTTAPYPDGTGEACFFTDLNNIISTSGQSLSLDVNNSYTAYNPYIQAVPNPFIPSTLFNEPGLNNQIRFTHLPQYCTINIKTPFEDIISLQHDDVFDSYKWWNLKNSNDSDINSGIYIYEILVNDIIQYRNSAIILMSNSDI